MEDVTTLPAAETATQVEEQQPATAPPAEPTQPAQPAAEAPSPAALLQQTLAELARLTLGLAEQRDALTERERVHRSIVAELDNRRVRIEIDEAACARLGGAAEALQVLVGGAQ